MSELLVDLAGDEWVVGEADELTFGRDAMLVVDANRFLHRRLGLFRFREGMWWLLNLGSAIALEIVDNATPSRLVLAPGSSTPIPFGSCWIRFQAGPSSYELGVLIPEPEEFEIETLDTDSSTTISASRLNLNAEQRLLLIALAETRLSDNQTDRDALPTNRQAADRLGWTITKFNRKLDNLCTKFDRLGVVSGIKGDLGDVASGRRGRLVDHVITVGIVSVEDLALLGEVTA